MKDSFSGKVGRRGREVERRRVNLTYCVLIQLLAAWNQAAAVLFANRPLLEKSKLSVVD